MTWFHVNDLRFWSKLTEVWNEIVFYDINIFGKRYFCLSQAFYVCEMKSLNFL